MGRIRTVKPDFFTNEELSLLPECTHLLAAGLICYADDDGYFNANPGLIKANVFPLREPSVSIPEMLRQLARADYLLLGKGSDGKSYGKISTFAKHQRVSHPTPSRIRGMAIEWDYSLNTHHGLIENSGVIPEDSRKSPESLRPEGKGIEGKGREEEGIPEDDFSPSMVARAVMDDLRLAGRDLLIVLESVATLEMRNKASAEDTRNRMVAAWKLYEKSKPELDYTKSPAKFYGDGDWRNPTGWPRKKSVQKQDPMAKIKYAR